MPCHPVVPGSDLCGSSASGHNLTSSCHPSVADSERSRLYGISMFFSRFIFSLVKFPECYVCCNLLGMTQFMLSIHLSIRISGCNDCLDIQAALFYRRFWLFRVYDKQNLIFFQLLFFPCTFCQLCVKYAFRFYECMG